MKKLYLLVLLGAFGLNLMANPVDVETAKQLGQKYMAANHRSTSVLTLAYTEKTDTGWNACYVFNCQPKGFVIVAADDRMQPILAYSTESSFNLVAAEVGPRVFLDAYRCDLQTAIAENMEQSNEIQAQWLSLEQTGRLSNRGSRTIGPLCTSTWHQTQLYNDQCPEDPEGYNGHVKSGCVANAMAQIMRYWEWPKTGVGEHSYYCYGYGSTSYGTLSVNFGEAEYHYEFMPDFLDYTSPQYEVDAVALLQYHAGVSVDMSYGPNASGAYTDDSVDAFIQYFRYASNTSRIDRDYYSDSQWIEELITEIDNGRPMLYSAYSYTKDATRGGHAFVCDGYDENQFFHFNWGWQGFDNGFYSINAMNLTHHEYNYNHYTTINLEPNAEYYNQPMPVSDLNIEPWAYGMAINLAATAPSETIGGAPLTGIDSVVLLMNGELLHSFVAPQPGETLELEAFLENEDSGVKNYFTIYPVTSAGRGKTVTDTVAMWTAAQASSIPVTFILHDDVGDGWLSPAISILDERGIVQHRVGLEEGSEATVSVNLPVNHDLTLYWNYCNVGYEDDDAECTFGLYGYNGELVYAQNRKPEVGPLHTFHSDWDVVVTPDYITAEYEYRADGTYGTLVSWSSQVNPWLDWFILERYNDPNGSPVEEWYIDPDQFEYFDEVEPGTYYYRLYAAYSAGGGVPSNSGYAPNLENAELDYAMVTVTSVEELFNDEFTTVMVFNMLGQQVYSGQVSSMNPESWKSGIYFLYYQGNHTNVVKLLRP